MIPLLLNYPRISKELKRKSLKKKALKRYINDYEKTAQFLEKEKWVQDLCVEDKLSQAIVRSKRFEPEHGSYSNMHEAFDVLLKDAQAK